MPKTTQIQLRIVLLFYDVIVLFVLKDYFQLRILLKYIICNLP